MRTQPASTRGSRYALLAQTLMDAISQGGYPVGSLLPTESALCLEYGVSRTTVREAIRTLRDLGVVSAKAGVGTIVRTANARPRFVHAIQSISDIFQYSKATREPVLLSTSEIKAGEDEAQLLRCPVGQRWTRIETTRTFEREKAPMVYVQSFLQTIYAGVVNQVSKNKDPLYSLIEQQYGERVVEVQQEFKSLRIPAMEARILKVKSGTPGLFVLRHYLNELDNIVLVQISIYPGERFSYAMTHRDNRQSGS
jgi:GntR family transcriptional regulator